MKLVGLQIKVDRTARPAFLVLGLVPAAVRVLYAAVFRRSELDARSLLLVPVLGASVAAFHALGQFTHQIGHALAARATGYAMTGVRYEYGFSYSEYPHDEPHVADGVHIARSLGGTGGAVVTLATVAALWLRWRTAKHWFGRWLLGFMLFDAVLLVVMSTISDVMFVVQKGWLAVPPDAPPTTDDAEGVVKPG